jgi:hypothetical protein
MIHNSDQIVDNSDQVVNSDQIADSSDQIVDQHNDSLHRKCLIKTFIRSDSE